MMAMATIQIEVPEAMKKYIVVADSRDAFERDAMILYPYIHNHSISHGRAAEILGVHKTDLIAYYDNIGLPYLDQTEEELDDDLRDYYAAKESAT